MLKLAGNSSSRHILRRRERKDSHRNDRTMSECDMMSVSGPSSETLSIVKLLATSLTSYRFAKPVFGVWLQAEGLSGRQEPHPPDILASVGTQSRERISSPNAVTAGPRIAPGNQG